MMKPPKPVRGSSLPFPIIRSLVETYYDFQHQRIITGNRIFAVQKLHNLSDKQMEELGVMQIFTKAESFENDLKKIFKKEIQNFPIATDYLLKIWGIGEVLTAGLLAYIENPAKFDTVSKLWQYSGFGMNTYCHKCEEFTWVHVEFKNKEGKKVKAKKFASFPKCPICKSETEPRIQRRQVGYISNWNDKLKKHMWKISTSFEKQQAIHKKTGEPKSGYRKRYDELKEEEKRKHPTKTKIEGKTVFNDGHIRNRALHRLSKEFLRNLWVQWREMEDLPTKPSYAEQILKHSELPRPFTDK